MVIRRVRDQIKGSSRAVAIAALLACMSIAGTARAIPIGDFSWNEHTQDECDAGICGAFFSVGNFSNDPDFSLGLLGDSFLDVLVDLQTDGGLQVLSLGDIVPGASSQSIEDLFGAIVASARLTLTFSIPALPGTLQLLDADGNLVTALTAPGSLLIDFAVRAVPAPVAEPSVLLLLASGLICAALGRRPRNAADGSPGARA